MGCFPNRKKEPEIKIIRNTIIRITPGLFVTQGVGTIHKEYAILEYIGQGSYGKVYKAKHRKTGVLRAIKKINKSHFSSIEDEEKLIKEISILKELDHPNILKIYEFFNSQNELYIVSEMLTGGELFKRIIEEKHFSEKVAAHIMKQLLSAIQFCHSNNIIHRDLKPENILIESFEERKKEFFTIRVIDFGTSEHKKNKMLEEKIGSCYYIAPEVLNNKYNEKCDLWSCGVILYILLCGYAPFNAKTDDQILEKIKTGKFSMDDQPWNKISTEAKDLIKKLLTKNIEKRLTAEQALAHEWFSKVYQFKSQISENNLSTVVLNLKSFHSEIKLQQAVLSFLVHNMIQKDDVLQLRKVFLSFDENGDGRIAKSELQQGLQQMLPQEEAKLISTRLMGEVDTDNSGFIEYEEFLTASIDKNKILTEENLRYAFNVFDKDGSGKISFVEIKNILGCSDANGKINDKPFIDMINEIDINGDGEISFFEFKKMMFRMLKVDQR
jgi:calcium-dependent protein kinase